MSNVVTLRTDKRWKAVLEYRTDEAAKIIECYFEEIADLHGIIEHGPDWNLLIRCTVTLNRPDDGQHQDRVEMTRRQERSH